MTRGGWLKKRLVPFSPRRIRVVWWVTRAAKIFHHPVMGILRRELSRKAGLSWWQQGMLDDPEDIFFLHCRRVGGALQGRKILTGSHRSQHRRTTHVRTPTQADPCDTDERWESLLWRAGARRCCKEDSFSGNGVSPGIVEGKVPGGILAPEPSASARRDPGLPGHGPGLDAALPGCGGIGDGGGWDDDAWGGGRPRIRHPGGGGRAPGDHPFKNRPAHPGQRFNR